MTEDQPDNAEKKYEVAALFGTMRFGRDNGSEELVLRLLHKLAEVDENVQEVLT